MCYCLSELNNSEAIVQKILRSHRNQSYRTMVVFAMLVSWLFVLVSWTCAKPMPMLPTVAESMPADCPEFNQYHDQTKLASPSDQDCVFKSCPDSQPNPAFSIKTVKLEIPVFILFMTCLIGYIFHYRSIRQISIRVKPPSGKPIPLIYRFCVLLN